MILVQEYFHLCSKNHYVYIFILKKKKHKKQWCNFHLVLIKTENVFLQKLIFIYLEILQHIKLRGNKIKNSLIEK